MRMILLMLLLVMPGYLLAEEYNSMHGFSLGDSITTVFERLGDPDRIIELEDGSKARVYFSDNHYVVFVSIPPDNSFIYSIQMTGEKSTADQSFAGIRLGDAFGKVLKILGNPTSSRSATDQATKENVVGTNIHFYGESYSFEEVSGKVSSIKITYDGTLSSDNPQDEKIMESQPIEIRKVRDYMLNDDYPELFGDDSYRIAVNDMQIIDFGNDGLIEVVVLLSPHYLQSPTIVIYQIQKNGAVKRIREGLAPGPLVKRGDYYLDSHSLGQAIDFTVGDKPISTEEGKNIIEAASDESGFGMVVQYRDFIHADNRSGKGAYIDMSYHEPYSNAKNCAEFEFSQVDMIKVGYKKNNEKIGFIAAIVGKYIYLYEISSIREDGFLEKNLTVKNIEN